MKIVRSPIIPRGKGGAFSLILNYVSFIFFAYFTSLCSELKDAGMTIIIFSHLTSPLTSASACNLVKKKRFKIPSGDMGIGPVA